MRLTSDSFMMSPFSRASTKIESRSMIGSPEVSEGVSEMHPPPTNSRAISRKRGVYFMGCASIAGHLEIIQEAFVLKNLKKSIAPGQPDSKLICEQKDA